MCHCSNIGVNWTPNKSQHTKLTLKKKFSCHSCQDSNSQPFNHESSTLTNKLSQHSYSTHKTYGQCDFTHSAPTRIWNNLSKAIQNSESAPSFKSTLKTYLFQLYNWTTGVCVSVCLFVCVWLCMCLCVCVCDLCKCMLVTIGALCKVLRAPERQGAIQILISSSSSTSIYYYYYYYLRTDLWYYYYYYLGTDLCLMHTERYL